MRQIEVLARVIELSSKDAAICVEKNIWRFSSGSKEAECRIYTTELNIKGHTNGTSFTGSNWREAYIKFLLAMRVFKPIKLAAVKPGAMGSPEGSVQDGDLNQVGRTDPK